MNLSPKLDLDRNNMRLLVKQRYYKQELTIDLTSMIILTTDIVITIVIINLDQFLGIVVLSWIRHAKYNFAAREARLVKTRKLYVMERAYLVQSPFLMAIVTSTFRQLVGVRFKVLDTEHPLPAPEQLLGDLTPTVTPALLRNLSENLKYQTLRKCDKINICLCNIYLLKSIYHTV